MKNIEYIPDYFITEEMCRTVGKVELDGKKHKEQKTIIRRQLLPIAWHPVVDWCFDEDEKRDLKRLWGELTISSVRVIL